MTPTVDEKTDTKDPERTGSVPSATAATPDVGSRSTLLNEDNFQKPQTPTVSKKAILVIHGIGQQQPFQPLDSFVNGMRAALLQDGREVTLVHHMRGREDVFDHCVQIKAIDPTARDEVTRLLDIYEFYWAPLTQGKATFKQIARWLLITGFTPLRRLAFNIPLLLQRAESRLEKRKRPIPKKPFPQPQTDKPGSHPLSRHIQNAWANRWLVLYVVGELALELWRLLYVPILATVLAGAAFLTVTQSTSLLKNIQTVLKPVLQTSLDFAGIASLACAVISLIVALALMLSIPEQIRDWSRLKKIEPLVFNEVTQAARLGYREGSGFFSKLGKGFLAGALSLLDAANARRAWQSEIKSRAVLLVASAFSFVAAASIATWLCLPSPECYWEICPKPIVYNPRCSTRELGSWLFVGDARVRGVDEASFCRLSG